MVEKQYESSWGLQVMDYVFKGMFHLSFAIDFVVYIAGNRTFRKAVMVDILGR